MEKRVFRMFRKSLFTNPGWRPLEITFPQKFLISPRAGRFFLIAIIALACLTPNGSYGAPVSYNYLFSGTMTSESTAIDGPTLCSPGDPFTGVMKYTYDPDAQPVSGYYNSPDDYSEVYANALEYSIKFNGISVYNSTDVHVGPQSLFGYGMGGIGVDSYDPKISCTETDLSMLYRNPVISGTNRLPVTLNPQQIKDMQVWCFMSYDNWMDNPDNWANMGIDVWAQVDTITRVEPVPEPATLLVLGPVLLSFAGFGKKLMKKNPS